MNTSQVEIRYMRGANNFGRPMVYCQLYSLADERMLLDGPISQALQYITAKNLDLVNSKKILDELVISFGFAS